MAIRRRLTRHQKDVILDRDGGICMYCQEELAAEVDHAKPWSWDHDDDPENLVASCRLCNALAGDMVFDSFEEKQEYILAKRKRRHAGVFLDSNCPYCGKPFKPGATGTNICCYDCANGWAE